MSLAPSNCPGTIICLGENQRLIQKVINAGLSMIGGFFFSTYRLWRHFKAVFHHGGKCIYSLHTFI
jgi:hypothetical protein